MAERKSSDKDTEEVMVYDRCKSLADSDAQKALASATQWRKTGGGYPAEHCEALALFNLGRYDEAAQRFHETATGAAGDAPALRADRFEQAGEAWMAANHYDKAKVEFDAALLLMPKDVEVLIDRAQANGLAQNYWAAIDDLNAALDIEPNRADALVLRASAYRRVEGYELALEDISRALKMDAQSADAYLERGDLLIAKGDAIGARQDWLKVIDLAPNSKVAEAAQQNLAQLDTVQKSAGTAAPDQPAPTTK